LLPRRALRDDALRCFTLADYCRPRDDTRGAKDCFAARVRRCCADTLAPIGDAARYAMLSSPMRDATRQLRFAY